ncbi:N-acetyl sugar amidotransferase WbpG [Olavius sp. associated proteobacterium Delta 1]|nr:N-acetyl sugar amidotransferase WbpG [Olavius sp. associated proteobacterium Delta 1]
MTQEYRICTRCIMDISDSEITFDENGICCHCKTYEAKARAGLYQGKAGREMLNKLIRVVRERGKNKKYDCIIGLSGGVDSSMVAFQVKKLGLRPLAVHLDNGWDSELSVFNIENIVKKLDIDLYSYVLNWEEFKDLQLSFLKASVMNCEGPTDHAIVAILYHLAADNGIRYIFSGSNIISEAILPASWGYDSKDWRHIKAVHKKLGNVKLTTFPRLTLFHFAYYTFVKQIGFIPILNYIDYNRKDAINVLKHELGWEEYGAKHCESIYTRFFQTYILPKKFNIDKRRAHLSTLVCSGQITREDALKEIAREPSSTDSLEQDRQYFIKKFDFTEEEFNSIMSAPTKSFKEYPNNYFWFEKLSFIVHFAHRKATHKAPLT